MALALSTVIVLAFGALVAIGELVARYRDKPTNTLQLPSSWFYIGVNAVASVGALAIIHGFGWRFGQSGAAALIMQVLAAGFGSAAIFRSSFFTVRVGTADVGIGPSVVLDSILAAADRATDRALAVMRATTITAILGNGDQRPIVFSKAILQLPPYCLALMQNLSASDQEALGTALAKLAVQDIPPEEKLEVLILTLVDAVGDEVVISAVAHLRPRIE
jgi:hypothetical protein